MNKFFIFLFTILCLCCDNKVSAQQSSYGKQYTDAMNYIYYIKDGRTGICFAIYGDFMKSDNKSDISFDIGSWSAGRTIFTQVPCSDAVEHQISIDLER